jgi:hypothetical protein
MKRPANVVLVRWAAAVLFGLGAVCGGVAGCTNGTTPVCDDAGSCLIAPSVTDGGDGGGAPADASADGG